jgi:uncharacterized Zn finger protein
MPRSAKGTAAAGSLRQFIGEVLEEEATLDDVREVIREALGATATSLVDCPSCGERFKAKLPDVKKKLDALVAALEQVEGRPEMRMPEATTVVLQRVELRESEVPAA